MAMFGRHPRCPGAINKQDHQAELRTSATDVTDLECEVKTGEVNELHAKVMVKWQSKLIVFE